ncbi:S-adenosyl-L-methionine-dependent methyltransferase [Ascodesmis nigricans]|uniref:S-adenosyl-L-methionine-dependent methyltransferase n=1 Tax=Ascodesmis nigricans TaxID=341454 RepID=A0A4S2MQH9_9PEZI|nr:S-adenosyl-L-methionine-dependent methyltransferase [Ascodesmis nigricans]
MYPSFPTTELGATGAGLSADCASATSTPSDFNSTNTAVLTMTTTTKATGWEPTPPTAAPPPQLPPITETPEVETNSPSASGANDDGADEVLPIEPEGDQGAFSDYEDDASVAGSTHSLSESVLEHVYHNGRRYHRKSEEQYVLPSDETEQDRLDMMHHLMLHTLRGRLCITQFQPHQDPPRVLDCGTGTGLWALDFGDRHPASEVIGTDLMPLQPSWTYPNVRFELDDLEKTWTWKKGYFDFIHARMISMGIRDYPRLVSQMFRHSAPGARVEIAEHPLDGPYCDDGTVPANSCLHRYHRAIETALQGMGINTKLRPRDYERMLEAAGYVDVNIYRYKMPWGHWPKNRESKYQGLVALETLKSGLEAYGLQLLTRSMQEEEARALIRETYETLAEGRMHVYAWLWVVTGRKPV